MASSRGSRSWDGRRQYGRNLAGCHVSTCPATLTERPFGGWKESGYGKEGGHQGTEEYMVTKLVALGVAQRNMPKVGV
jgi:acyl-CoA reductase-like NAD-dependent aldehyde dehydrogenase